MRRGPHEVRDVQNIADILVDPEGALERRNHWEKTSHALLVGAILHVLYAEDDKTLRGVANCLSDPTHAFRDDTAPHDADLAPGRSSAPGRGVRGARSPQQERQRAIRRAFHRNELLGLYRDPTVAQSPRVATGASPISSPASIPVSLYLVVPPSDISRTKPLIRLILNQIGRRLTESLDGSDGIARRQRLLLMLDEFPALGRLDFFESRRWPFMAGYGLRAFLIAQSLNQIDKAYGPNHSILDNCHVRIAFATNDERTAKRISDALGTATELRAQRNYAGHRLAPWLGHLMVSRQETARPLLTPGEVMQLPPNDELVMVRVSRRFAPRSSAITRIAISWRAPMSRPNSPTTVMRIVRHREPMTGVRFGHWPNWQIQPTRPPRNHPLEGTTVALRGALSWTQPRSLRSRSHAATTRPCLMAATTSMSKLVSPSFSNRRPDPRLQRAARLAALDPNDGISL